MSTPQPTVETPQDGISEPVESKPADILARISSDPQFAVESFKKAQSNGTKLAQKLQALKPLEEIASRLDGGAAAAAQALYEHAAILNHPSVQEVVKHYRTTGSLPTASAPRNDPSDDDYTDPVELHSRDLADLKAELAALRAETNRHQANIVATSTQAHLAKLAEKHADIWDVIKESLIERAESFEATPQGRRTLSDASFETWENLAKIAISDNLDAVLAKRAQTRVTQQSALGTEPRATNVTTGREGSIEAAERWRPGSTRKWVEGLMRRDGRLV